MSCCCFFFVLQGSLKNLRFHCCSFKNVPIMTEKLRVQESKPKQADSVKDTFSGETRCLSASCRSCINSQKFQHVIQMKSQTVKHFVFYCFVKNNTFDSLFTYVFIEESCAMGFTVVLFQQFYLIARQPHATIQPYEPRESFVLKKYSLHTSKLDKQHGSENKSACNEQCL